MSRSRTNSGLTFTELMVVMLIMLFVAGAVSKLLFSAYESEAAIEGQNLMQKMAQRAADTMVDSLRATAEITSGTATQVSARFRNGDRITYYQDGRELKCTTVYGGVTKPGQVISDRISALQFSYYTITAGVWTETDTPSAARALRVSVTLSEGKDRATETSAVKLRNKL